MPDIKGNILFVESDEAERKALNRLVEARDFNDKYMIVESVSKAKAALEKDKFDAVISDYILNDGTAFDILDLVKDAPVIVVTDAGDVEIAVKAMKAGAYDYIIKDSSLDYLNVLPVTIKNAIKRKEDVEKLRLLESAVVNANDAIIIFEAEPAGMIGRRILYVNEAFSKMTGYTYEEAVKSTLRILRGPRTSLSALNEIRVALEQVKPVMVELINYRKDGTEFWVECNIVPFVDEKGSFVHWVSVQRDITERKKAEEEKEKLIREIESINTNLTELNQELETIGAERTMSLMALTVADRIRNPAAIIGGRCRRILGKEELSESLRAGIMNIIEGAEQLDKIVKDFEELLRNRQSKFKYEDLNKVVESIASVSVKEAASKGVEMIVSISKEALRINMQRELLRVAIFHLMKNAVEATPSGGNVTVKTYREGGCMILMVSDTGYGIPKEDVENIFRPFFSTKEQRFGMGLPLVKQIVTEHLGELVVESKPGKGSTFKLYFPEKWNEDRLSYHSSDTKK